MDTASDDYADRLHRKQQVWWKKILPVQAPYRWNLRRQKLGKTIDVGCGIGRNMDVLAPGSVGVDHNEAAVLMARERGMPAMTVDEWMVSDQRVEGSFDGMLVAHVIEHLERDEAIEVLKMYLPYLRPGGKVFMVCPQERGYASDPTHVWFATGDDLVALAHDLGLETKPAFSFPFPRWAGKPFIYNEFCVLARKPL